MVNERYQDGRSTSIVAGLRPLPLPRTEAVLVASVDQPRSVELLLALREAWERKRPPIAVPSLNHRVGHPPLFSAALLPELLGVTEEQEDTEETPVAPPPEQRRRSSTLRAGAADDPRAAVAELIVSAELLKNKEKNKKFRKIYDVFII